MNNLMIYKDFETHDKGVNEARNMINGGVVMMAHHLKAIKENKLYKALGDDGQNTWGSYCGSKGINMNTANKYIAMYNFYVLEMKKDPTEIATMSTDTLSRYQNALEKSNPEKREELFEIMKSDLSITDKHKAFVDEKLAKPQWLTIKTCDTCKKHEIHYEQGSICNCKGVTAIYAKPIL